MAAPSFPSAIEILMAHRRDHCFPWTRDRIETLSEDWLRAMSNFPASLDTATYNDLVNEIGMRLIEQLLRQQILKPSSGNSH